jgi:hypothetical protein
MTNERIEGSSAPAALASIEIVPPLGGEAADKGAPQMAPKAIAAATIETGHLFICAPYAAAKRQSADCSEAIANTELS